MDEFALIEKWFRQPSLTPHTHNMILGNGDDCTLLSIPEGTFLAQSIDTCVAGKHFPHDAPACLAGYRTLASCISDLAAMGARPHSFSLALTMPEIDENWISGLVSGMTSLAREYNMALIGGDTTQGPLTLTFHVQGLVGKNYLFRAGAKAGDRIFVSGTLGDAGGALPLVLEGKLPENTNDSFCDMSDTENQLLNAYYRPKPQIILGQWLCEQGASAAIDISDGLLADLGHILAASGVGAKIDSTRVPLSRALLSHYDLSAAQKLAMTAGDDYQLCFCWPEEQPFPDNCPENVTEIGVITREKGIRDKTGTVYAPAGFRHFS